MRCIGHLPDEALARRLSDFLHAQGVRNEVERDGNSAWSLWVHEENQLPAAQGWFARFQTDPSAAEFQGAAEDAARARKTEERELAEYRRRLRTRGSLFRDLKAYRPGVVTYGLIVVCVVVGLLSKLGQDNSVLRYLLISYPEGGAAGFLPEVRAGEVWRVVTPMLVHFGPAHLLFNMLWLFQLGSMIEARQGHIQLALLILGLAAISNVAQYCVAGPAFGGMSGVIYGLFGYAWIRGKVDPVSGLSIDSQTVILMLVWFFVCFRGWVGPIANTAHATGLVLGAAYGCASGLLARNKRG